MKSIIRLSVCFALLASTLNFSCKKDSTTQDVPNDTVKDFDNNIYHPIQIGTQTWLLENLKTTHYRNGEEIAHIEDGPTWFAMETSAYCEYGDPDVYGRLYNFYTVIDSRNICPAGYHIPSDAEWQTLINYLGGDAIAGGKLKEIGIDHWETPNVGATNSSGFTALPAGYRHGGDTRDYYNYKANLTNTAAFWTSTSSSDIAQAYAWQTNYSNSTALKNTSYKGAGLSIRCIKD